MSGRVEIPPKQVGETVTYTFDFTAKLSAGETISTKTCTAIVYSGTDASPSTVISGSASSVGALVSQKLTAGTVGVLYTITCTITTSNGNTLELLGLLAIVPST